MQFSIDTAAIQKAIKLLSVVVKVNAVDTTGRVLIEANEDEVVFSANNGVTAISFKATAVTVEVPGKNAVAYSKLRSFISSYKIWDGENGVKNVAFVEDGRNIKVTLDNMFNGKTIKGKLKLSTFNPELMTKVPGFSELSFSLNSTIFRAATNKVLYAVNPQTDSNQPALQGMNVKFEDDDIFFAGSDGVGLSEYQVKNSSGQLDGNVILQYDFVTGLHRLLNDDIILMWDISDNKVVVKFDDIVFSGRRIVGHEFPNYRGIFDNYVDYTYFSKDFILGLLYPFSDILNSEDNFRITLEIKDKLLSIYNDQARVDAELEIVGGLDFSIDLNGKYLTHTIEVIKDDYIVFKFSSANSFAIFDAHTFNDQKALISAIRKR